MLAVSGVTPRGRVGRWCREVGGRWGLGRVPGPLPEVEGPVMLVPKAWEAGVHQAELNDRDGLWGKRCFSHCLRVSSSIQGVYNSWNGH